LSFDGDAAGLKAADRAARLALPVLQPGCSLRFVFLPDGEDPDSFLRSYGPGAMRKLLDAAEPLSHVLWRRLTEDRDFATPERRAGLERELAEITAQIRDSKVADYYRRDFEGRVFETFKRRARSGASRGGYVSRPPGRQGRPGGPVIVERVSAAVRGSALAQAGNARLLKERELLSLALACPDLIVRHGEVLAELPFSDRSLDSLRHELLNLAASGFSLESGKLENHLVRAGMSALMQRLTTRRAVGGADPAVTPEGEGADSDEVEGRWLRAAAQLREMAELDPERKRALERFKSEASEESWRDAHRLLLSRTLPND
jgi:DNA primase